MFGSNLLNLLVIIGGVSLISPIPVPDQIMNSDLWIMLAVTIALLIVAFAWRKIGRVTGVAFVIAYLVYVFQLVAA